MSLLEVPQTLDTIAAFTQFKLLGYPKGCEVHYRGFYPKGDPRTQGKNPDKGRKVTSVVQSIPEDLRRWTEDKRGCYFVINSGGAKDAEIDTYRAIFYEHDDLEKDLQLTLWQILDLPEPTFQVDTGGKSIHSYWVFEQPITDLGNWRSLQEDLIALAGSDPVIKNPARVMRLAGSINPATGQYASIVTKSGQRYGYESLRSTIPHRRKEQAISVPIPAQNNEEDEIFRALSFIPRRIANTGSYEIYRNTLWALKSHFGEARSIEIMEGHSPSAECGWNIAQIARSGGKDIKIGSLFHYAKQYGWVAPQKSTQNNSDKSERTGITSTQVKTKNVGELRSLVERIDQEQDIFQRVLFEQELGSTYGVRGRTLDRLVDALTPLSQSSTQFLSDLSLSIYEQIEQRAISSTVPGYKCGFFDLDAMLQGFQQSDLIVIAGRPSMGKTAFSLNLVRNMTEINQFPSLFFSLEMSSSQLHYRLLSSEVEIPSQSLRRGMIRDDQWGVLAEATSRLASIPIALDDSPNLKIDFIRQKSLEVIKDKGSLGLIMIDYLQLMTSDSGENRTLEISKITRELKQLARELNVPIFALSQLSRAVESRQNKRPQMSDLRESGSIEQDADLILMLYRDEYHNPDTPDRGMAEVSIVKNRNGPVGTIKLLFQPEFTKFKNLARF